MQQLDITEFEFDVKVGKYLLKLNGVYIVHSVCFCNLPYGSINWLLLAVFFSGIGVRKWRTVTNWWSTEYQLVINFRINYVFLGIIVEWHNETLMLKLWNTCFIWWRFCLFDLLYCTKIILKYYRSLNARVHIISNMIIFTYWVWSAISCTLRLFQTATIDKEKATVNHCILRRFSYSIMAVSP